MKLNDSTRVSLHIDPDGSVELTIQQNAMGDFRKSEVTDTVVLQDEEVFKLKKLLERI